MYAPQKALHCALDRAVASRCLADPHESYVDAPRPFEQSPVQAVGFADTAPERYAVNGVAHALLRHNDNKLGALGPTFFAPAPHGNRRIAQSGRGASAAREQGVDSCRRTEFLFLIESKPFHRR